jgi:hypothetical protein
MEKMYSMITWSDTTYNVPATEPVVVHQHGTDAISLHVPGFCLDGRGFAVYLHINHLAALREAVATLEDLLMYQLERKEEEYKGN